MVVVVVVGGRGGGREFDRRVGSVRCLWMTREFDRFATKECVVVEGLMSGRLTMGKKRN